MEDEKLKSLFCLGINICDLWLVKWDTLFCDVYMLSLETVFAIALAE